MAVKSIIDIELRDEAFRKFNSLFDQYNDKLKTMPTHWAKVDNILKSNVGFVKKISLLVKTTADQVKRAETNQKKFTAAAQGSARILGVLVKSSGQIAKNILSATGGLLKWASLSGLATGLLGAGGLFGISRLAESAGQMQITARGAGVTPGQLKAAQINYGQLLGGEGGVTHLLGTLTQMVRNETMRAPLAAIGITNFDELKKKSTYDLMKDLLPKLRSEFLKGGGSLAIAEAKGMTKFLDPNTLVALSQYTEKELKDLIKRGDVSAKQLAIQDRTLGEWANLNRTLGVSGQTIENVLLNSLVKLGPSIEKLSSSFADAIKTLTDSPVVKGGLDKIGEGIKTFADYLTTTKFQEDMQSFLEGVEKVGKSLVSLAEFIGQMIPEKSIRETIGETGAKTASSVGTTPTPLGLAVSSTAQVLKFIHVFQNPAGDQVPMQTIAAGK